jgi:dienelactone hydrolase
MKKLILFVLLFAGSLHINAQETFYFKEGLASGAVHQYGRQALYVDALAYELYQGGLSPKEGAPVINNSQSKNTWVKMLPDSNHVFRGPALGGGYLYLQYPSSKKQTAVIIATGNAMLYVNGVPHGGDQYRYGWMNIPVELKKGLNEIYIRTVGMGRFGALSAKLEFPKKPIEILTKDPTLPFFVKGETAGPQWAGVVVRNTSAISAKELAIEAIVEDKSIRTALPTVIALATRKVPLQIPVPSDIQKGNYRLGLKLYNGKKLIDTTSLYVTAVNADEHASYTFVSDIDGSVQYYAVAPQKNSNGQAPSLFFSVHGAEVEAISQARAYKQKEEGPVVAPTNRRPRGFNWEDWGRLDALEVLNIAKKRFSPDPQRIYLTGHSMGGHGTWYLGATYAGQWAAIAPCAGYPTLAGYGSADGQIPTDASSPIRKMLVRASNPANVLELAKNYKAGGVYIFHGDADPTVPVRLARQMRQVLGEFHQDFSYYEYPGGSHWFGDQSVDWKPIFDYFKWHTIPALDAANEIDFSTASTAISATHRWITILQQQKSYDYSRVVLSRNLKAGTIKGTTENIGALKIDLPGFNIGDTIKIELDKEAITVIKTSENGVVLTRDGKWNVGSAPSLSEKGIIRNGGLKEAFNHRMIFVYGTKGTAEENAWSYNKAVYDLETWYFRGNGAVDVLSDVEFLKINYADRGIVLYGNNTTNAAAAALLKECPIKMERGKASVGNKTYTGDDIGAFYIWPNSLSNHSMIALIGGTGIQGMRAADANQYFSGGSGFPDFMVFTIDMLKGGDNGLKAAGFYGNQWQLGQDYQLAN